MAISLQDLQYLLNKQAAQAKPDAGSQAMMMAAQAARPAGAPPLPKPIDVEDGMTEHSEMDKEIKEKESELEKAKAENEKLRHELNKTDLAHQQEIMMREIEKKEKESMDRIKAELDSLKNEKTLHQAENIQHKAKLDKDTAMAQVKIEQEKSKALIDYNKQQVQEQIKRTDEARKQSDQYKDQARQEAEKMKDEARAYIDDYRSQMQKNIDQERTSMQQSLDQQRQSFEETKKAISPALDQLMDSTLKTLHTIPMVDSPPVIMKQSCHINETQSEQVNTECLNLIDMVGSVEPTMQLCKQSNTAYNKLLDGYVVKIPTSYGYNFIKCASSPTDQISDFFRGIYFRFNPEDKAQQERGQEAYRRIMAIDPNAGQFFTFFANSEEPNLVAGVKQAELNAYIQQQIIEGNLDRWKPFIQWVDANQASQLERAQSQGLNFSKNTPTKSRTEEHNLRLYGIGREFAPHYVSGRVNREAETALGDAARQGLNFYDETDGTGNNLIPLTQRYSLRPVRDESGKVLYHSTYLSHDDQEKLVKVWDSLSPRNQQAMGNLLHPHFRAEVGWHPLSDSDYWDHEYAARRSQVLSSNPYTYNVNKNNPANRNHERVTTKTIARGRAPEVETPYVNKYDSITNGWYTTVGNFIPTANTVLNNMGFSWQLPSLAGTGDTGLQFKKPAVQVSPEYTSAELRGGGHKDVRMGAGVHSQYTSGARRLRQQQQNF